jgi:alpha-glucoside transport system permease protein
MTQTRSKTRERKAKPALRTLGWGAIIVATLGFLWLGVVILLDPEDVTGILASFYGLLGADGQAAAIEQRGLQQGFIRLITAVFALLVGVGGVWILYTATNALVEVAPSRIRPRLRPWVFVLPALILLGVYLVFPLVQTIRLSITEDGGFVDNFRFVFTDPGMQIAMRNNALWLIVGTSGAVVIGLFFAVLVDRVKREAFAKTFVFLPLAISAVGASVIWRFVYAWRPEGRDQIGLVNAMWTRAGNEPVAFLQVMPWNNLFLIIIMVWLQTGFAMVVLSAALKGVPTDIVEAARIDGANESQLFFRVVLPSIRGAVITVATTVFIAILKVFDIVFVMTGGRFETEVIANRMFAEMFSFRNFGRASALAVVLLIVVIPIMAVNIRNLRRQGIGA